MSFNVSVFWRFCVICFIFVNLGSLGSSQNGSVVTTLSSTVSPTLSAHSHHLTTNNQINGNPAPGHDVSVNTSSESHPTGVHLSTPKNGSNTPISGNVTNPQAPHMVSTVEPPTSLTVTRHHVSVEVGKPQADNIILDMAHPAARQNMRAGKWNPTFAAIVAAICITTAVGGYIMLMAWRKIEMDRYGNRQMLINEDDFGDIQDEDMRHFEASCIQIEA